MNQDANPTFSTVSINRAIKRGQRVEHRSCRVTAVKRVRGTLYVRTDCKYMPNYWWLVGECPIIIHSLAGGAK